VLNERQIFNFWKRMNLYFFFYSLLSFHVFASFIYSNENAEKVFTYIYEQGTWGRNEYGYGISGSGSSIENAAAYMKFLEDFIKANEIKSVVDVGCGDWSFSRHINWNLAHYTGIDVVKAVIEKNQILFTSPTVTFLCGDILNMNFPSADLLICKDVLQHLSNEDIKVFLTKLNHYKHCLITNDTDAYTLSSTNEQIPRGEYRNLDLTKSPFNHKGVKILNFRAGLVTKQVLYFSNIADVL
jgi:SAM-dependent methyltransferase